MRKQDIGPDNILLDRHPSLLNYWTLVNSVSALLAVVVALIVRSFLPDDGWVLLASAGTAMVLYALFRFIVPALFDLSPKLSATLSGKSSRVLSVGCYRNSAPIKRLIINGKLDEEQEARLYFQLDDIISRSIESRDGQHLFPDHPLRHARYQDALDRMDRAVMSGDIAEVERTWTSLPDTVPRPDIT